MTAVVTMLAASHATAQKQPAAKAAETARLAGVGVQLFLEDSGRLSPDVTEIADFRGFNMQANGTGIALERFTDFLISVRFEAPGETFAKGRQATEHWLTAHFDSVGERSTIDIRQLFQGDEDALDGNRITRDALFRQPPAAAQ